MTAPDELSTQALAETREPIEQAASRPRKLSLVRSRSVSTEAEYSPEGATSSSRSKESLFSEQKKKDEEKTFSVTILVNEHEKNKIVDLLHKAKSIISKKVEKVMGKKPKSAITNVDALQTVLESWMDRAESEEREDSRLVERLIQEQGFQMESLLKDGKEAPVTFPTIPTVEVDATTPEHEGSELAEYLGEDMEVARLTSPRLLQPPQRRTRGPSEPFSPTRSLSPAEGVPCPFGNRPDSELYPPRLRRPSSLYGAGAAAASSRPPSRQVSASPSVLALQELETEHYGWVDQGSKQEQETEAGALEETDEWEYEEEVEAEVAEETYTVEKEKPIKYCRPDSFIVPIGGMWNPREDPLEGEVKWSTVEPVEESREGEEACPECAQATNTPA